MKTEVDNQKNLFCIVLPDLQTASTCAVEVFSLKSLLNKGLSVFCNLSQKVK
jgi:hypothetical protein